jgi:heat-inducible transcriptional repressor
MPSNHSKAAPPPKAVLSERAQHLLRVLVERYIRDGQPVGSRALARDAGLDLSPATIRNVMADLEDLGFVKAPHTSAGRVPTVQGYRFFIDALLTVKPLGTHEVEVFKRALDPDLNTQGLVESASALLSGITRMAGVVTMPRREHASLRHLEFLGLSDNRVLAILVLSEREVQNRIIHTDRHYGADELQQAANYLNAQFAGRDINDVRDDLLREMQEARESMNRMMLAAIEMAAKVFEARAPKDDYVLAGQTNLMDFAELSSVEKLRVLFDAFNRKRDILHLLDQCIRAQGVQIFIGEESGYQMLGECSVVTAPYSSEGRVLGVLGIIGPTRMAYERVIPIVDVTAKLLGAALNPRN